MTDAKFVFDKDVKKDGRAKEVVDFLSKKATERGSVDITNADLLELYSKFYVRRALNRLVKEGLVELKIEDNKKQLKLVGKFTSD